MISARCIVRLAARGETPAAFGRRCIPADCVPPPSNIPDILGRRALSPGRLAALGATLDFHHGLLAHEMRPPKMQPRSHEDTKHARKMYSRAFFVVSCLRGKKCSNDGRC